MMNDELIHFIFRSIVIDIVKEPVDKKKEKEKTKSNQIHGG
jgi:hypothetical protein